MNKNFYYIIIGLLIIIGVGSVRGACVTPVNNITINTGITQFCGDSNTWYNLIGIANSSTRGAISFNTSASNIYLDCNNTHLNGSLLLASKAIKVAGGNNVTIINCNVSNYAYPLDIGYNSPISNISIINSSFHHAINHNVYVGGVNGLFMSGLQIYSANLSHGLYLDCLVNNSPEKNVLITNSYFYDNPNNAGIQINSANVCRVDNVTIKNSIIYNNKFGINDLATNNSIIQNNTIYNNSINDIVLSYNQASTGCLFGAINTNITNNIINTSSVYTYTISNCTSNNVITNNTYYSPMINIRGYPSDTNFIFIENTNLKVNYTTNVPTSVLFDYIGIKNFAIYNSNNLSINNQLAQFPNNDIKNVSTNTILASNVDNYSVSLSPNQQISVGDYMWWNSFNGTIFTALPNQNLTITGTLCPLNDTCIVSIDFDLAEVSQ